MSEDRDSDIEAIYIPLLDEGLPVMRPAQGRTLGGGMYLVLPTPQYDSEDEHWQFSPGSMVMCMRERRDGDDILVARELISIGEKQNHEAASVSAREMLKGRYGFPDVWALNIKGAQMYGRQLKERTESLSKSTFLEQKLFDGISDRIFALLTLDSQRHINARIDEMSFRIFENYWPKTELYLNLGDGLIRRR